MNLVRLIEDWNPWVLLVSAYLTINKLVLLKIISLKYILPLLSSIVVVTFVKTSVQRALVNPTQISDDDGITTNSDGPVEIYFQNFIVGIHFERVPRLQGHWTVVGIEDVDALYCHDILVKDNLG